jgi:hypothetical protein
VAVGAGELSCEFVDREEIPVHIIDLDDRGEWSENANRKDFARGEVLVARPGLHPKMN